jgi:hypothetical protein
MGSSGKSLLISVNLTYYICSGSVATLHLCCEGIRPLSPPASDHFSHMEIFSRVMAEQADKCMFVTLLALRRLIDLT